MEVRSSFNLLLGCPWLQKLGAVPSSYQQKIKLLLRGVPINIDTSPMKIQVMDKPQLTVQHIEEDEELLGFVVVSIEEDDLVPFDFDPHSKLMVNAMLRE